MLTCLFHVITVRGVHVFMSRPPFLLQLVVRHPNDPSYMFAWGSLYMLMQDYMKAKECYHDALSISQSHNPRLQMLDLLQTSFL